MKEFKINISYIDYKGKIKYIDRIIEAEDKVDAEQRLDNITLESFDYDVITVEEI